MMTGKSVILALLGLLSLHYVGAQDESQCQSEAFRNLTPRQQNVHQCSILENMQAEMYKRGTTQADKFDDLSRLMTRLHDNMLRGFRTVARSSRRDQARSTPGLGDIPMARDCQELYQAGIKVSGIYPIRLPTRTFVNVRCDMDTMYGGWTVIQRRVDGSVNFTRRWAEYAFGFGNINSEYFLGNEHLNRITTILKYSLLVELWDWDDNYAYALYDNFHVGNEYTLYQLRTQNYSGTAGDTLGVYHDGMRFSTFDSDNDQWHSSCAVMDQSGWWFDKCGKASLNGPYKPNSSAEKVQEGMFKGITWYDWKQSSKYSMKKVEMKIKPFTSVQFEREQEELAKLTTSTTTTPIPTTTTTTSTTTKPTTTTTRRTTTSTSPKTTSTVTLPETTTQKLTTTETIPTSTEKLLTTSSSKTSAASSTTSSLTTTLLPVTSYKPYNGGQNGDAESDFRKELEALREARRKLEEEIERFKILEKKRNQLNQKGAI